MSEARKRRLIDPVEIGKKGGLSRAQNMTPEQRSKSASAAAKARWGKKKRGGAKS